MKDLEHPDITSALKTGYPLRQQYREEHICPVCNYNSIESESYEVDGEEICEECMLEIVKDILMHDPLEAAKFIGAKRRYVC